MDMKRVRPCHIRHRLTTSLKYLWRNAHLVRTPNDTCLRSLSYSEVVIRDGIWANKKVVSSHVRLPHAQGRQRNTGAKIGNISHTRKFLERKMQGRKQKEWKSLAESEKVLIFETSECRQRARNDMLASIISSWTFLPPTPEGLSKERLSPRFFYYFRNDFQES